MNCIFFLGTSDSQSMLKFFCLGNNGYLGEVEMYEHTLFDDFEAFLRA